MAASGLLRPLQAVVQQVERQRRRLVSTYADSLASQWQGGVPAPLVPAVPLSPRPAAEAGLTVALICHVFYADLLEEVRRAAESLPGRSDVYLSVVGRQDAESARAAFADWAGQVVVRVVPNRGRDIAPKYVTFADVLQADYDAVLFLHTKKSADRRLGEQWRRYLFEELAGSPERVAGILDLFAKEPELGVVAAEHFPEIRPWIGWNGNYAEARRLGRRLGLAMRSWAPPDFPSGSMFWVRPRALAKLGDLHLTSEDFPGEPSDPKNTVMHALERLVYVVANAAGFRIAVISAGAAPVLGGTSGVEHVRRAPGLRARLAAASSALRSTRPGRKRLLKLLRPAGDDDRRAP